MFEVMREIVKRGKTVFLVEQNVENALEIAK
jgi:ABC-type branched-subunit amino acid transport system ATPase component